MESYEYYKFHNILVVPSKKIKHLINIKSKALPKAWKLILMNDGSFTQNLNSLTGAHIQLKKNYRTSNIFLNQKKSSGLFGLKTI